MVENLVSGKKYRILVDAANDVWDRISFWTKASDVYYDDGTTVEVNKPNAMLKRNTFYSVGSVTYENSAPSWVMLKCTTAGTTAATAPSTYSTISSPGTVITDGTARFTVYDVRPSSTLSTSSYQVPAMSLVNNLSSELTVNGTKFYFDYQDGKYGYNTSASRGASTFSPFGNFDPMNARHLVGDGGPIVINNVKRALIIHYSFDSEYGAVAYRGAMKIYYKDGNNFTLRSQQGDHTRLGYSGVTDSSVTLTFDSWGILLHQCFVFEY